MSEKKIYVHYEGNPQLTQRYVCGSESVEAIVEVLRVSFALSLACLLSQSA
jgi:hypothetical protein